MKLMTNHDPLISIVIPVYKVEKYLRKSIDSALRQSYKNIEIILVDDGSPDACPAICDEYASEHDCIKVIHKKNGGLSDARNAGLELSGGKYVLFLDSDDMLESNAIEDLLAEALKNNADVVFSDRYYLMSEETGETTKRKHFDKLENVNEPITFTLEVMLGRGRAWRASGVLYNNTLIRKHNITFPSGYIAEDIVFNLQIMAHAKSIGIYQGITINCLKRAGSITTSFQPGFVNSLFLIDDKINDFLVCSMHNDDYGQLKRKELLCRNSIVYITAIFSGKCDWEPDKKRKAANSFLDKNRITECFEIGGINPYFNKMHETLYFRIMFLLLKYKFRRSAFRLALLVDKIR